MKNKKNPCSSYTRGGRASSFDWLTLATLTIAVAAVVAPLSLASAENSTTTATTDTSSAAAPVEMEDQIAPVVAVLFPAFSVTIGVIVFYVLSRYFHALPYTGVMFLIGTLMGISVELNTTTDNHLNESIKQWISINGAVLFLVFLPGLIFKDSFSQNAHLFCLALSQCILFAFPLVLAGTVLTALVAYYIFPFGWSFNLAMTFGSILTATDPVAVAALLEEVGAPPRLKVHINGEALLNDGSAIVFYSIFSARYFYELEGLGLGEPVDLKRGIAIFCQKALGAVASGIFFGIVLLVMLYFCHRRFNRVENVVEVSATIAVAYTGYYVSEVVWGMSGVISTVVTGLIVSFFGLPMINDPELLDAFWVLVEHLLNTVLFTLGGVVWGSVISKGEQDGSFRAQEWGYLLLLYVLLTVIRLGLFVAAYPLSSRIGLKTNWRETLFQIHAGLRGAVGITLAIALDNEVQQNATDNEYQSIYAEETQKAFAFTGGIAFLTLIINGVTARPVLCKLGLADSTESREKIVSAYQARFKAHLMEEMVKLLSQPRFSSVNFAFIKHHVPYLEDMTRSQLLEAVENYQDTTRAEDYYSPELKRILPYLTADDDMPYDASTLTTTDQEQENEELYFKRIIRTRNRKKCRSVSNMSSMLKASGDSLSLKEFRLLFVSILRSAYKYQIRSGELEDRQILAIALGASLDFAADSISNGSELNDWDYLQAFDGSLTSVGRNLHKRFEASKFLQSMCGKHARTKLIDRTNRLLIERSLSFMAAHRWAQAFMLKEFAETDSELSDLGKIIFAESRAEYKKAQEVLDRLDPQEVALVVSHKCCLILLNSAISYITNLVRYGLLKDDEAEQLTAEIEEHINDTLLCDKVVHPGELSFADEDQNTKIELTNGASAN